MIDGALPHYMGNALFRVKVIPNGYFVIQMYRCSYASYLLLFKLLLLARSNEVSFDCVQAERVSGEIADSSVLRKKRVGLPVGVEAAFQSENLVHDIKKGDSINQRPVSTGV